MDGTESQLAALLEDRYRSGPVTLQPIGELNPVYRVERTEGAPWVVRVGRNVQRYAACLRYLAEHGYPAPRLVSTASGSDLASIGDRPVIVMTLLTGRRPPREPAAMELVGEALARLHALPLTGAALLPPIERAGMQPRREIAAARSWIESASTAAPIVSAAKAVMPECVNAVIRGYCRHRTPTADELAHLIHAIRFRPLMWACATFEREVKRGVTPSDWPLDRLRMSDELAAVALDALAAAR